MAVTNSKDFEDEMRVYNLTPKSIAFVLEKGQDKFMMEEDFSADAAEQFLKDYLDGGKLKSKPSTIMQLFEDGTHLVLREGGFKV